MALERPYTLCREIELGSVTRTMEAAAPSGAEVGGRDSRAKARHAAQVCAKPWRDEVLRLDGARGILAVGGLSMQRVVHGHIDETRIGAIEKL